MSGPPEMAVLRGLHLAAMLVLLGTLAFLSFVLPASSGRPATLLRTLTRLCRISGIVAVIAGGGWLVMEAAAIAGAETLSDLRDALPVVVAHTRFGQVVTLRLVLLVLATLLAEPSRIRAWLGLLLAIAAATLQGVTGHAGAAGGAIGDGLVASEALHLVAAGLWIGALLPLWLSARALPLPQAGAVCERFSPLGLGCVLVLAGTGFAQAFELIGNIPVLLGTPYGHIALLKIGLFLIALLLAAYNRLGLTDRLVDGIPRARRRLLVSIAVETLIGLAIVMTAAFLASNVPAVHGQPVWPLPWRFSLTTVNEDADFQWEAIVSVALIGATLLLLIGALLLRRFRLLMLVLLIAVVAWRGPSLSLLTVEAYPTSFQTSPTGFAAASIVRGQALFAQQCVVCHGPEGQGNGPAAAGMRIRPADLTQPHIFEHSDGEMYWWLSHGIGDPEGGLAMPGFGGHLSSNDLWALIDYVRAHAAGMEAQRAGSYDDAIRAPAIALSCDGLAASTMADLAGHAVHVVTQSGQGMAIPPVGSVQTLTLLLARHSLPPAPQGGCVAADPAAWSAYAVLAGMPADNLDGTQFLIGPNGWLRALYRPETDGWSLPEELTATVRAICANPVEHADGGIHEHHH